MTALMQALQLGAQSGPAGGSDGGVVLRAATQLGAPTAAMPPAQADDIPLRLRPVGALAVPAKRPDGAAAPGDLSQVVIKVRLNGMAKGDFLAYMTGKEEFLLPTRELAEMGVPNPAGRIADIEGEPYLFLNSIARAEVRFNEKTLTLDLQLPPDMLPAQRVDLGAQTPNTPMQRRQPGGFLNYSLGYGRSTGAPDTYTATTELGVNAGNFLFLDNHTVSTANQGQHGVRLQTQLIYDEPDVLRRWVIGDSYASSGDLGSSLNLGGISLNKLYQLNPYLIKTPLAAVAGAVTLPSTVDVYMDGARVLSQNVAPGNFNLQNLNSVSTVGLRNVEIVIRDAFGTEQRIGFPYFFTDQLLAKGLQEYSYNAGFLRNNFGVKSNDYGVAAFSAFHRYGVSDTLTVGAGADATREHANFDPRAAFNTVRAGIVSADVAFSRDSGSNGRSGRAASLSHTFLAGAFSSQVLVRRYSEDYSVIGSAPDTAQPKLQASAGVNYGNSAAGTYSLNYSVQTVYGGTNDQHTTTLGYTRTLGRNVALIANVSRVLQGSAGYAAFIGLSYFGADGQTAGVSRQKLQTGDVTNQFEIAKTPPIGEGLGYRLVADRALTSGTASDIVQPFVQYNARNAIFTAQGSSINSGAMGSSNNYQFAMAGAVAYIGGGAYFSRPITDSYGLVKIDPPLSGVRVLKGTAEIGVTGERGSVFVPNLGSYQVNEVAIQSKDIPLDYSVGQNTQKLRPPLRSGVLALFPVTRIQAITGRLKLRSDGKLIPIENVDVVLAGGAASATLSTIRDGDFYIENLAPGTYTAQLKAGAKACRLELTVPATQEIVANLGDIICEILN